MRIKKFLALAVAAAVAMTAAMSTSVSAAIKSSVANTEVSEDSKMLTIDLNKAGLDPSKVNGATVEVKFEIDDSDGFGGGIMFNSKSGGWQQDEKNYWGNPDADTPIKATGKNKKYTLKFKAASSAFKASDADVENKGYAQICVQQWWGKDMKVTDVTVGGKSINKKAATTKSSQTVTVATASKTYTAASLKTASASFSIGAKAQTALKYKSNNKNVTVSSSGTVTVAKGTAAGTYKVTVTAKATSSYKKAKKVVKIVVK